MKAAALALLLGACATTDRTSLAFDASTVGAPDAKAGDSRRMKMDKQR